VNSWQRHKIRLGLTVLILGSLGVWFIAREPSPWPGAPSGDLTKPAPVPTRHNVKTRAADNAVIDDEAAFDFYLLALTMHPAFCADGNARLPECRAQGPRPLVIHGLWPERVTPRTYPQDCPADALDLEASLEQELTEWMPGMAANLHEHEWRKHGGCSGLDDDEYFRRSIDLARGLDAALRAKLTTLAGRETTATELRETADLFQPGIAETFTLHCRKLRGAPPGERERPYLVEIRQCVDNDGPDGAPGTLLDCASVQRRDQGCGAAFNIAGPGEGT